MRGLLHFVRIQDPQLAFPVTGVDRAQGIVSQQPVFHHKGSDGAVEVGSEDGIVSYSKSEDDEQFHTFFF